jgi:hypothetical protein
MKIKIEDMENGTCLSQQTPSSKSHFTIPLTKSKLFEHIATLVNAEVEKYVIDPDTGVMIERQNAGVVVAYGGGKFIIPWPDMCAALVTS